MLLSNKRLSLLIVAIAALSHAQQVAFEWKYPNFTWPSQQTYENAIKDGSYIPKNGIITGIKVHKNKVYLSLPRWFTGVPATLTVLSKNAEKSSPLLEPYPNWRMQKLDDCSAFQYVQSMEIDPEGRMWVLENGRTEFRTERPRTKCPARLVILNLENDGEILLDYKFPENVVNSKSVFLNDLVLDHEGGGYAYITDHDSKYPGIVVFSLRDRTSWKISHDRSMKADRDACEFKYDEDVKVIEGTVDGIALSGVSNVSNKDVRILYYTPLSSYEIFAIPVGVLKDRQLSANIDGYVKLLGRKSSQTDGLVMSSNGWLYFGLLTEDAVAYYDTTSGKNLTGNQKVLYQDKETNQWPDTFAMDVEGWLWWTSNSLLKADEDSVKFHVIKTKTPSKSYQYFEDGTYPKLPAIV